MEPMMQRLKPVLAAFAAAALVAAGAQARDPMTVSGVEIDAQAATAFEAQRRAMSEGQARAARILIERLTLPEDRLESGVMGVTPEDAASLIAGLQIADEQRSSTRYRGILSVEFDPRAVRRYLDGLSVPYVESPSAPVLVVPVLDRAGDDAVWRGGWYEAWRQGGFENALTPFIALGSRRGEEDEPLGRGLVSAAAARALDEDALRALAGLYEVEAVAVILARESAGEVRAAGAILHFEGGGVRREDLPMASGASFIQAASQIVQRRQDDWKRAAVVRGAERAEMEITFLFNSLSEWRALQGAVAGASLVENARLDAISRTGAAMSVTYRGVREQLAAELAARGARLEQDPQLGWTVRRR